MEDLGSSSPPPVLPRLEPCIQNPRLLSCSPRLSAHGGTVVISPCTRGPHNLLLRLCFPPTSQQA